MFRIRNGAQPLFLAATEKTQPVCDPQVTDRLCDRYKYIVRACASGTKGEFSDAIVPVAGEIQEMPALETPILGAVSREKQRIDLYWTPIKGSVRYRIYRDRQKIDETANPYVCTYRNRTVSFGNTYQYVVTAVDAFGNESDSGMVQIAHDTDFLTASDSKTARKGKRILRYF